MGLVSSKPFDFAPGEQYLYNNSGYYLLGMIIEQVTGESYRAYMQTDVFDRLGLAATTYCDERRIIKHRAEGYEHEDGELVNDEFLSMDQPFAAGALCSDVLDLLKWQRALEHGEVVSEASYRQMTTPGALIDGTRLEYGFGLSLGELEGHRRVRHGGGINGFRTMLARYPDDDLSIVVLTNTPGPTAGRVAERIARLVLGLEIVEILDEPLSAEEAAAYEGTYDLGDGQLLITYQEGSLHGEIEGEGRFALRSQGDHVFVPDFSDALRLEFQLEDGRATRLSLTGGPELEGVRIK